MRRPAAVVLQWLSALVITVVALLGGPASPVAAAPRTWWVDDDGTVGAGDCSGAVEVFTSIQLTIELAGRGDTIKVCPGTYTQGLVFDGWSKRGITLESVVKHGAILRPSEEAHANSIIQVNETRVTIDGFRLQLGPTDRSCGSSTGVLVQDVNRITLRNLLLEAEYAEDVNHYQCRYAGIVGGAWVLFTIESSELTGYLDAIAVGGTVRIVGNRLELDGRRRPDDDTTPCPKPAIKVSGGNREQPAIVKDNVIIQGDPPEGAAPNPVCIGIESRGVTSITENTIDGTQIGIEAYNRPLIANNTVRHVTIVGIHLFGRGEVRSNTFAGGFTGIHALGRRAYIHDNSVSGVSGEACVDDTSPDGTSWPFTFGTGNRWVNNRGASSRPVGLCTAAAS